MSKSAAEHGSSSERRRAKVSVTVDPELLRAVDRFIAEHEGVDRSKIVSDALWLWCARQQELAMEEQFRTPLTAEQESEYADWRAIRRAAAKRLFERE